MAIPGFPAPVFLQVTHLVIQRPKSFRFQPGDYVFLNIPAIAAYEWHPFSISSAPEQPGPSVLPDFSIPGTFCVPWHPSRVPTVMLFRLGWGSERSRPMEGGSMG